MNRLATYAPLVEKIFFGGLLLGVILTLIHVEPFDTTVTVVSLYGLGVAYYLSAFQRFESRQDESTAIGFKELLAFSIVPKVLWLSSAVSVVGIAMFVMGTASQGYKQMMMIGGAAIAFGTVVTLILLTGGAGVKKPILPALLRAIPLLIGDLYLFTR
jgi:hypothetical protein